jgi:DNA-binding transcriptional ArsR family regulator
LIDRIRKEIEERLAEIQAEERQLRQVLAALETGTTTAAAGAARRAPREVPRRGAGAAADKPAGGRRRSGSGRGASGETKARVLEALADGAAKTAGEVAAASGLGRGSVSTTLSKLAKAGELVKADRGYQLK